MKYEKEGGLIDESEYLNEVDLDHLKGICNNIMVLKSNIKNPEILEYTPEIDTVKQMFYRIKDRESLVKIQS